MRLGNRSGVAMSHRSASMTPTLPARYGLESYTWARLPNVDRPLHTRHPVLSYKVIATAGGDV
jgi:hypothetical protein